MRDRLKGLTASGCKFWREPYGIAMIAAEHTLIPLDRLVNWTLTAQSASHLCIAQVRPPHSPLTKYAHPAIASDSLQFVLVNRQSFHYCNRAEGVAQVVTTVKSEKTQYDSRLLTTDLAG